MAKLLSATIRMYYTGFGDCFLLTFWYGTDSSDPAKKGKTLWIDFGARAGKAARMQAIATHLKEHLIEQGLVRNNKPFIDVLAITHEHQDHISGLKQAWENLDELTFGQVWFAWTEDPADELAKSWRKHKQKTRDSLQKANQQITAEKNHLAAKPGADSGRVQVIDKLASQLDLAFGFELGVDSVTDTKSNPSFLANADYQKLAEKVGAGNVRFLRPGYTDAAMKIVPGHVVSDNSTSKAGATTFPGLSLYVLGPPRDLGIIRASEPENWQTSLRADSQLSDYNFEQANFSDCVDSAEKDFWYYVQKAPFDEEFVLPIDLKISALPQLAGRSIQENETYVSRTVQASFNNLTETQVFKNYFDPAQNWRQIDTDYLSSANDMAIKLNTGVNNTSLVLAIEIDETEEVFFFSGDAEFGVWDDWDKDQKKAAGQRQYTWTRPTSTGTRNVTVEDLMSRAIFYKVGHHGSQNATPNTRGIGKLSNPHLHCMIPVDEKVATNFGWNRIPYSDLIKTLTDRQVPFVRADNSAETTTMAQQQTKVLPSGSQVTWSRDDDQTDRNLFIDWILTLDRQAK